MKARGFDWHVVSLTAIGVVIFAYLVSGVFGPFIVINRTPSYPEGAYFLWRASKGIKNGAVVYFDPGEKYLQIARERNYLPPRGFFMKEILAVGGQTVCNVNGRLLVDGVDYGEIFETDSSHLALTPLRGCVTIQPDEFFPYSPFDRSYDGRYIGPVKTKRIKGILKPIYLKGE